ncbi:MAG: hypothetical protein ACI4AN_01265 [Muribaculaceae bacterium]
MHQIPHTFSTSGAECVGLPIIVPLRGTARAARTLWQMEALHRSRRSHFVADGGIAPLAIVATSPPFAEPRGTVALAPSKRAVWGYPL